MQSNIQSILETEKKKKEMIEKALKIKSEKLSKEEWSLIEKIKKLEQEIKEEYGNQSWSLRENMKKSYNNISAEYDANTGKINNIDTNPESNRVFSNFIASL